MPFHITVVPASTKAGRETIRVLPESENKPYIHGIYRDPSKAPAEFIECKNFEATEGDVGTGAGLSFAGSDAVFYIPPPIYDGTDQGEWATRTATNVKNSLRNAPRVKRLLLFSAVGSQYDQSIGILRLNHISDMILKDAALEVFIVRPGYFQEDWAHLLGMALADPPAIQSWITPVDHKVPMVKLRKPKRHKQMLCKLPTGRVNQTQPPLFQAIRSPALQLYRSQDAVGEVTGKEVELKPVKRDELAGFFAKQVPEGYVQELVDMTTALLPGGIMVGDFEYDENTIKGRVQLVDTLRQLYTKT
ncbi:Fc.00g079310.m01.CDS01 [Cosmosporella sp. VM-42]